jgi:hypothetical protein
MAGVGKKNARMSLSQACTCLENSGILADLYCLFSVTNLILLAELQA